MKSLHIGTYFGIPVKVHWTFGLLIFYVLYVSIRESLAAADTIFFALFILLLFFCVILHEYGHALTARKYGVKTVDIIISPIGGVARLEHLPKKPSQELAVAIAGPLVNLAIAALLLGVGHLLWGLETMRSEPAELDNLSNPIVFIVATITLNVFLCLFNLIPAFPMDGGRILRALLNIKLSRSTATNIAAKTGQGIALLFMGWAFYNSNFQVGLIGLFVYLTAGNENKVVQLEEKLSQKTASSLMKTDISRLFIGDEMSVPFAIYKATEEQNFLCFDSLGNIAGILPYQYLKAAMHANLEQDKVMQHLAKNYCIISSSTPLDQVFQQMNHNGLSLAVIKNGDQILGVIDRHMLQDYLST